MAVKRIPADVSEALNTISYRIEKTESDFIGHLQKVESKLEQIAEVTRTVAVLQQQTNQQTDQITELRSQLREYSQKIDSSVARIHTRLDEITNHTRDKLELSSKEQELHVKTVETKADSTEKELRQWLNRGIGAWAILAFVAAVVQTGFYRWIDAIEKDRTKIEAVVTSTASTVDKHTQQLENVITITKEQQLTNKRLEQMVIDADKQLELTRNSIRDRK